MGNSVGRIGRMLPIVQGDVANAGLVSRVLATGIEVGVPEAASAVGSMNAAVLKRHTLHDAELGVSLVAMAKPRTAQGPQETFAREVDAAFGSSFFAPAVERAD